METNVAGVGVQGSSSPHLTWQPVAGAGSLRPIMLVLPGAGTRTWGQDRSCGSATLTGKTGGGC